MTPLIDRLFSKVDWPSCISACWTWTAGKNDSGYGQIRDESRPGQKAAVVKAHRASYELARGPIPEDKELDHLCRNRACINPMHLEIVTQKINIFRGQSFTADNARKLECRSGHRFTDENTYVWRGWRMCRTCRRERYRSV